MVKMQGREPAVNERRRNRSNCVTVKQELFYFSMTPAELAETNLIRSAQENVTIVSNRKSHKRDNTEKSRS